MTPLDFVTRTYGPTAADEAWSEFVGHKEPFNPATGHVVLLMSWFMHRWSPRPGRSKIVDAALVGRIPAELYLERNAQRMDPSARR